MSKRNPYELTEKILRGARTVAAYAVMILAAGVALAAITYGFWTSLGWGPWALLAPPVCLLGLIVIVVVVGLGYAAADWIVIRWSTAKYRWSREHRGDA